MGFPHILFLLSISVDAILNCTFSVFVGSFVRTPLLAPFILIVIQSYLQLLSDAHSSIIG